MEKSIFIKEELTGKERKKRNSKKFTRVRKTKSYCIVLSSRKFFRVTFKSPKKIALTSNKKMELKSFWKDRDWQEKKRRENWMF